MEAIMSRRTLLLTSIILLGCMAAAPSQGLAHSTAVLLPLLAPPDDWNSGEEDPEGPLEGSEEALESEPPTPPRTAPPPVTRRPGPRSRYHRWQEARRVAHDEKSNRYKNYLDSRFSASPKRFGLKIALDIGSLGNSSAGQWDTYYGLDGPTYRDLYDYEVSVSFQGCYRLIPFFEMVAALSHVRLDGNEVRVFPSGSTLYLEDFSLTTLWGGPKLVLPLGLPARFWGSDTGMRDSRATNIYLMPLCLGLTYQSSAQAEYQGQSFDYFETDIRFFYSFRLGFEMHFHGLGFFLEGGFALYGTPAESTDGVLDTKADALTAVFIEIGAFYSF
jgi:hypothetical protein